jgi:tRNA(Ile)-lysidine synthase
MLHPLESKLSDAWPPAQWANVTVLLAVSGGCDSVALLRAIAALKTGGEGRVCAAHLNHRLRPDADDDEQFVVGLCRQLGVPCETGRIEVDRLADESGESIEAAARKARYRFLEQAAGRLGARFVVTAHTADDQAETILHRIVRGTGVRGLAGMSRARPLGHATLGRPLLGVRHAELRAYLDAINQPFCHDPSNLDHRFTRNRIRLGLMPRLQQSYNPVVVEALLRLGGLAGQCTAVVDGLVEQWFERCVSGDGPGAVKIALGRLAAEPPYVVRELLMAVWRRQQWPMQAMGMAKWDELAELALSSASATRRDLPGGVTVEVAEATMRLRKPVD